MANFPLPKGYQRLGAFPLDETEIFTSDASAIAYAISPSAYAGQKISVVKDASNSADVYVILPDGSLGSIGLEGEFLFKSGTGDYSVEQINSGNTNQSISEGSVTFGKDNLTGGQSDAILTEMYNAFADGTPNFVVVLVDPGTYTEIVGWILDEYDEPNYTANILSVTDDIFGPGTYGLTLDVNPPNLIDTEFISYVISPPTDSLNGVTFGSDNINIGKNSFVSGENNSNRGVTSSVIGINNSNGSIYSSINGSNISNIGNNSGEDLTKIYNGVYLSDSGGVTTLAIGGILGSGYLNNRLLYIPTQVVIYLGDTLIGTYDVDGYDPEDNMLSIVGTLLEDTYNIHITIPSSKLVSGGNNHGIGYDNILSNIHSYSIGKSNISSDIGNFTIGLNNAIYGEYTLALGYNNIVGNESGEKNVLIGHSSYINDCDDLLILGYNNKSDDVNGGMIIGEDNESYNNSISTILGKSNNIYDGVAATLIGGYNSNSASNAIILGNNCVVNVDGTRSVSIGSNSTISERNGISIGTYSDVSGIYSLNMCSGDNEFTTQVQANGSAAIGGYRNKITCADHVAGGEENGYETIIGGRGNIIDVSAGAHLYNTIINCKDSSIVGKNYTTIIGGDNITATQSNMVYVPALMLATPTTPADPEEGTMYYDGSNFLGRDASGWTILGGSGGSTPSEVTASNGLTKVDNSIGLGGTLTQATIIDSNGYGFSVGVNTIASGANSTAFGNSTTASGSYSTAFGTNTDASGYASAAFGNSTIASGAFSTALGFNTIASEYTATSFGSNTTASGGTSTAFGADTTASGYTATSFGDDTTASGYTATSFGSSTTASGDFSTAFGSNTTASGVNSTAFGFNTIASGELSTALGANNTAGGEADFVTGVNNDVSTLSSSAIIGGQHNVISVDPSGGLNVILGGHDNIIHNTYNSCMIAGSDCSIFDSNATIISSNYSIIGEGGHNSAIISGDQNEIYNQGCIAGGNEIIINGLVSFGFGDKSTIDSSLSVVLGGQYHNIAGGAERSAIIAGYDSSILSTGNRSVILGGYNQIASQPDTVYVPALVLKPKVGAPVAPEEGNVYFNSTDKHFYGYNGTTWVSLS